MNKYEKSFGIIYKRFGNANWFECAIAPMLVDLEDATGEEVEFCGPAGLRTEILISVGAGEKKRWLTVMPGFDDQHQLQLFYDTGEKTEKHAPGTVADMNGFNNVSKPLPETLDEILKLFRVEG